MPKITQKHKLSFQNQQNVQQMKLYSKSNWTQWDYFIHLFQLNQIICL